MTKKITHEQFIASVAKVLISFVKNAADREKLNNIKLVYGAGPDGVRGVTYYSRWQNGHTDPAPFVEISAFNQESVVQIVGTTAHELGHVLAGFGAGHGPDWHKACAKLGLTKLLAGGTDYQWDVNFDPKLAKKLQALPVPTDGQPKSLASVFAGLNPGAAAPVFKLKPCGAGIGTKGGKSRGKGSGSRLRLFECECVPVIKVRLARDEFDATCNCCSTKFHFVAR